MTAAGPDRTLRMRLGASLGPEVVALIMALAFLVALGVMLPRATLLPRVVGVLPTVGPAASGGAAIPRPLGIRAASFLAPRGGTVGPRDQ